MSILTWIILGALAGWIASMVAGTNERMGALANIGVGIVGALLGGFLISLVGGSGVTGFNLGSLVIAIVGSVLLLSIFKSVSSNSIH